MSKWVITDGVTGRLCIIPDGPFLKERLAYGCIVHKEVECFGLLQALKRLHEFEQQGC